MSKQDDAFLEKLMQHIDDNKRKWMPNGIELDLYCIRLIYRASDTDHTVEVESTNNWAVITVELPGREGPKAFVFDSDRAKRLYDFLLPIAVPRLKKKNSSARKAITDALGL